MTSIRSKYAVSLSNKSSGRPRSFYLHCPFFVLLKQAFVCGMINRALHNNKHKYDKDFTQGYQEILYVYCIIKNTYFDLDLDVITLSDLATQRMVVVIILLGYYTKWAANCNKN